MIASAERMEAEFEALSRQVSGRDARLSGRVRVATTDALATTFMPEIASFTRRYPEIEIDLLSTPEPAELAMREAEVALLVTDRPPPSLVGRRLAALPSALYAARRYLADHPADGELASHLWVGWEDGMSHIPAARWLREQVPDARIACRVSSGATLARRSAPVSGSAICSASWPTRIPRSCSCGRPSPRSRRASGCSPTRICARPAACACSSTRWPRRSAATSSASPRATRPSARNLAAARHA